MNQQIGNIALLVRDYDEAIRFFTEKLNFRLVEDRSLSEVKRWVRVAPPGNSGSTLLLAKASTPEQQACVGNQSGGRVFLFLYTDDFWRDYQKMKSAGIEFTETPRGEEYGTVVVFKDVYGNKWDLIESKNQ